MRFENSNIIAIDKSIREKKHDVKTNADEEKMQ